MPQFTDQDNNIITVRPDKCYKGLPLPRMTDQQLQAVGYARYTFPTLPSYVPTVEERVQQLDMACRSHIDNEVHWTAGPMVWEKAKTKPKSKAIKDWSEACWVQFFTNRAMLNAGLPWNDSMLDYPAFPADVTIEEAMQE